MPFKKTVSCQRPLFVFARRPQKRPPKRGSRKSRKVYKGGPKGLLLTPPFPTPRSQMAIPPISYARKQPSNTTPKGHHFGTRIHLELIAFGAKTHFGILLGVLLGSILGSILEAAGQKQSFKNESKMGPCFE